MANMYAAVGKMLKPVKSDLATIKDQLTAISNSLDEMRDRMEEIEKVLIPEEEAKKA
jgi:septal ring factor EnvC (AmiA/AmiB activator)